MASAGDFGYTATDVSEVLWRLSSVAANRELALPHGVSADPQELQARWQVVAAAAGDGSYTLDPVTLEQLKAIYNCVEAVVISCGAPDSFDVYEVCFEALTKIGFYLKSDASKENLLKVLEEVHEVYDVLLSCVETYEWVQPGATGLLRLWMLQVVFACFGANSISGRDLMELTDNDVSGAVSLISFLLRCDQAPFVMQSAAGRCLVELTAADSVFLNREEGSQDWQGEQITKLTAMLNRHVNGLIKGLIQFDVIEAFGRCICQHQMSHLRTDIIVKSFLTTIHNCLLYCSENQKKLRQHLATQSTIVQDIMIPYVHNILPALYDNPSCGPSLIEWQNLKSVMQTFVVVTFNINVFRPQLRDTDMLPKLMEVPKILTQISMLELLIKLAINVDFTRGPYFAQVTQDLQAAFEALPPESQARLRRRLTSEQSMRLPFARSSIQAVEALAFALTLEQAEEAPATEEHRQARRKKGWRNAKAKTRKRKRLFAMQKTNVSNTAEVGDDDNDEDDSDDDDDMPPLIPADNWESHLGAADEAGIPSLALCQLSGALMLDPMMTPEGHLFERAALEDWFSHHGTNPLTGLPLSMESCTEAIELQNMIQGYQLQVLSVVEIAQEALSAFAAAMPQEAAAAALATPPAVASLPGPAALPQAGSLLGDLPPLSPAEQTKQDKKEKSKIRIESRSVVDCPEDMRCAIDGKVMVNPVRSPYGHCFEKKTLERWIANCGSVCPISQKPLRMEECLPDAEMKKRVVKFLKGQQ